MLGYQLFHEPAELFEPAAWLARLSPELLAELGELADALAPPAHAIESPRIVPEWPLHIHRRYDRREVQTACGDMTPQRRRSHREGVLRLADAKTELFFVTLDKSEGGFSPTTSYRDYAISRDLFHWETQNSAAEDTPTGRRYIEQDGRLAVPAVRARDARRRLRRARPRSLREPYRRAPDGHHVEAGNAYAGGAVRAVRGAVGCLNRLAALTRSEARRGDPPGWPDGPGPSRPRGR